VAGRQDKAVAIDPPRLVRILDESVAEKHRPDFSATQGKAEVAAHGLVDGIDGETARFVGSFG
jgi:hypothetical protein